MLLDTLKLQYRPIIVVGIAPCKVYPSRLQIPNRYRQYCKEIGRYLLSG